MNQESSTGAGGDAVRRFISKLEQFASGLSSDEREMLRVALHLDRRGSVGDVRGFLMTQYTGAQQAPPDA